MNKCVRKMVMLLSIVAMLATLYPSAALASQAYDSVGDSAAGSSAQVDAGYTNLESMVGQESIVEPESAKCSSLKAAGLKFDLKPGKTVKVKSYLRGTDSATYAVKMTTPKIVSAGKAKKKATFTVTYSLNSITAKQKLGLFKAIRKGYSGNQLWGSRFFSVVDYATGLSLMNPSNKFGVKVTTSSTSTTTKKYAITNGPWFRLQKTWKVKFTITYPSTYKNMCLGVGATTYAYSAHNSTSKKFHKKGSKITYYKTQYYTKCKSNTHFRRIK